MMNVTVENFDDEVVAASMHTPVLVDFWAPWCGPCKVIGPLLEKIETDYAGRFKLVKIDSDQEQELSSNAERRQTCAPPRHEGPWHCARRGPRYRCLRGTTGKERTSCLQSG